MIRPATASDGARICEIYNHYVAHTTVTFEEDPVSATAMAERIVDVTAQFPWLVYESPDGVLGYAYATAFHKRAAYRLTVESTIYIATDARGRGIGRELYGRLLGGLRAQGLHCVVGVIALPNPGSVALHEKLGFGKVGHLTEVGRKLGRWVDVGFWQLRF